MAKKTFLFQTELKGPVNRSIPENDYIKFNGTNVESGIYAVDGIITVTKPGQYLVNWFVAQSTGMATNGHNFALLLDEDDDFNWQTSTHVKIAGGSGFATIDIKELIVPVHFKLVNVSDAPAVLSSRTHAIAGIAFYGVDLSEVLDKSDLEYLFKELAAAHFQFNDATRAVVLSGEEIPFNDYVDHYIFDNSHIDDHIIQIPVSGRYLISWHVPVMSSDFAEEVELALQILVGGGPDWDTVTTSYIPLPIGMVSGTTVKELDEGTWVRVINATESVSITTTHNSEFLNLGFYDKFVISGPEGTKEIGDVNVFVEVDETLIGPDYELPVLDENHLQSKVKVVKPYNLGLAPDDPVHVFTESEVIASEHPENYSLLLNFGTWEPLVNGSGQKIYVDIPYNSDRYIIARNEGGNHVYPLNSTSPVNSHHCIPGAFPSELYISGLIAEVDPSGPNTLYTAIEITDVNEPAIRIHKPADLVLTQVAKTEFEEAVVIEP